MAGEASEEPLTLRSRAQLAALFDGVETVPPGLVDITDWPRPDPGVTSAGTWAAVGVKPGRVS